MSSTIVKKDNINMNVNMYVIITAMKTFKKNKKSHDNADVLK
jgi:hypothetical protein